MLRPCQDRLDANFVSVNSFPRLPLALCLSEDTPASSAPGAFAGKEASFMQGSCDVVLK